MKQKNAQSSKSLSNQGGTSSILEGALVTLLHNRLLASFGMIASRTIARPNAILLGGATAFLTVLGTYIFAKYLALTLSGSELFLGFLTGWSLGTFLDIIVFLFKKANTLT